MIGYHILGRSRSLRGPQEDTAEVPTLTISFNGKVAIRDNLSHLLQGVVVKFSRWLQLV